MGKKKVRQSIKTNLTERQAEAVERAVAESGKQRSVYLRDLVAVDCGKREIDWPEDENAHGGNRFYNCPECKSFDVKPIYGILLKSFHCLKCGHEY